MAVRLKRAKSAKQATELEAVEARKRWYAVNGIKYLGPFMTPDAAATAAKEKWPDLSPGTRMGSVELLDPEARHPTYGLTGPLVPRYK